MSMLSLQTILDKGKDYIIRTEVDIKAAFPLSFPNIKACLHHIFKKLLNNKVGEGWSRKKRATKSSSTKYICALF